MKRNLLIAVMMSMITWSLHASQLAFPGAEGFGAYSVGGRGGTVVHVTNLNATGAGSLADAVSKPNRIVVFDVGGVINITGHNMAIASNITIAGQTAPGEGITVYGAPVTLANSSNVIIRYMRFRGSINMSSGSCTIGFDNTKNVIMDHCSISWGRWDNAHIKDADHITWQYCILTEGILPQRFGAITDGTRNWTVTHCLWSNNKSRNPKMKCYLQYINNIVYNFSLGAVGGHSSGDNYQDLINNYFICGPQNFSANSNQYFAEWTATDHMYSTGNYNDFKNDSTLDGNLITDYSTATPMTTPHLTCTAPLTIETAEQAYYSVVAGVGASLVRDVHDKRAIAQLTSLGTKGAFIDDETAVGGIGTLASGTKSRDSDCDGMPDKWETAHGLNPLENDASGDINNDGYTNIEEYINEQATKEAHETNSPDLFNTTALNMAIAETYTLMNSSIIGNVTLGYPQTAYDQLKKVVSSASQFLYQADSLTTTQAQMDSVITRLHIAQTAFTNTQIFTCQGYDPTKYVIIYSYGISSTSKNSSAATNTQRRYLTTVKTSDGNRDSLIYKLGLTEEQVDSGKMDVMSLLPSSHWVITTGSDGNVYLQNVASQAYLAVSSLLPTASKTVYPYFAKEDNGKCAFYIQVSKTDKHCLNVGNLSADGNTGPLAIATPADRTRLRWVIEQTSIPVTTAIGSVASGESRAISKKYYDLSGMEISQVPRQGICVEKTICADGNVKTKKYIAR